MFEQMPTASILIVEDEAKLAQLLADYLSREGYQTHQLGDGSTVIDTVRSTRFDLILLDLMLPGTDGITIMRKLREFSDIPVIMVTARVEEVDRLLGLNTGADDYVCKPYSPREVVARVQAILRRTQQRSLAASDRTLSLVRLDEERFEARVNGILLDLTPAEFRLLKTLTSNAHRVLSRDQLMNGLYEDYRVVGDRTVDTHVKNLRRKLEAAYTKPDWIQSIYGVGYRFL